VEWARLATIALAVLFTVLAMADGLALLRGIPGFLVFNDPLIAWGIGLRRAASTPAARRPTASARTQGVWVPALVAWSVPWGIVVAVTQAVGVQ
jgi:hypothetical protein